MSDHEHPSEFDPSQPDQPHDQFSADLEASVAEFFAEQRLEQSKADEATEATEAQQELDEQLKLIRDVIAVLGPLDSLDYNQVKEYLAFRRILNAALDELNMDNPPAHLVRQLFENHQKRSFNVLPSSERPQ